VGAELSVGHARIRRIHAPQSVQAVDGLVQSPCHLVGDPLHAAVEFRFVSTLGEGSPRTGFACLKCTGTDTPTAWRTAPVNDSSRRMLRITPRREARGMRLLSAAHGRTLGLF